MFLCIFFVCKQHLSDTFRGKLLNFRSNVALLQWIQPFHSSPLHITMTLYLFKTPRRDVVAERSTRQCIDRELPYWRFRTSSNPATAVVPFGRALYPHCQVFRRRLSAVGPVYRRVTPYARKRTHFTSRKRAGRNPGEVVRQSNIRKRVYDVDPSWFTLEGYITVCSLRTTSTRHLNMPYERRRRPPQCFANVSYYLQHKKDLFFITFLDFKWKMKISKTHTHTHKKNKMKRLSLWAIIID